MQTLRTLIIDDEPRLRSGMLRALRNFHFAMPEVGAEVCFEFDEAEDGEQGLEKIAAAPPDLLLLDHKLPGIQGLDLLELLRKDYPDIVTVMVTAYASIETAVAATKRGAFDFLSKPFTPDELKATLGKASRALVLGREAKRLAREKHQMRFQLISVVAHELKAPLAAIEGFLVLLKDPDVRNDPTNAAQAIDRSLIRLDGMRKLITDLLDLTRIESGQRIRSLQECDIVPIAHSCVETARMLDAAKNITIRTLFPERLDMTADPDEIRIIFNNLLSNAVKYNKQDGEVDFRLELHTKDEVCITVRDTGIGMTAEEAAKLFKEFVRIKNRKTRSIMGSGLGLNILKKIATLYGGNVTVNSEPDVGSTFRVCLLVSSSTSEATSNEASDTAS